MKHLLVFIVITLLGFYSCTNHDDLVLVENTGYAQGTTYQIKYRTQPSRNYGDEIKDIFAEIDSSMSTYLPASVISQVNKGATFVEVDSLFLKVLNRSLEIARETNGDFDPTIGPLVHLWGFGYEEVRQDVSEEMIADAKAKTGYQNIEIRNKEVRIPAGFSLDLNAIAQGFTVDHIAEFLEKRGIENYMVEVGGEIRAHGINANGEIWKIGVDKPQENIDIEDRFQFILRLEDASLATSGNYRKFWVDEESGMKYSHTIDPHSGKPAYNQLLSASIIASSAMDADAYATVCMVMGLDECKKFLSSKEELQAYLVYTNQKGEWVTYFTEGFSKYLVEQQEN